MKKSFVKPALTVLLTLLVAAMLVLSAWAFASPTIPVEKTVEATDEEYDFLNYL